MKKNIKLIVTILVVIILVAILLVVLNNVSEKTKEEGKDKEQEVIYKEPETKEKTFKSITTKNKEIKIDDATAYYRDGVTEIMLNIESKDNYSEMYATLEFEVNNKVVETKILHMTDLVAKEKFNYMIQSSLDLTETDDWKVNIVTETEAISVGYTEAEE